MRRADETITWKPQRIAVAGTSGVGKTTLCMELEKITGFPRVEIDGLHWGPDWTPRETFADDVERFTVQPRWIIELQYREVRPLIASRADTLLWLDYANPLTMQRLISRTLSRRIRGTELWNGNIEQPLSRIFTDRDHIIRWGWRTRNKLKPVMPTLEGRFEGLTVVRLRSPRETKRWLQALTDCNQQ